MPVVPGSVTALLRQLSDDSTRMIVVVHCQTITANQTWDGTHGIVDAATTISNNSYLCIEIAFYFGRLSSAAVNLSRHFHALALQTFRRSQPSVARTSSGVTGVELGSLQARPSPFRARNSQNSM